MSEYHKVEAVVMGTNMGVRSLHRLNTTVFMHEPIYQAFDHAFEQVDEDQGIYFFRENLQDADELLETLGEIGCQIIHQDKPSDYDRRAWVEIFDIEITAPENFVPEDWE